MFENRIKLNNEIFYVNNIGIDIQIEKILEKNVFVIKVGNKIIIYLPIRSIFNGISIRYHPLKWQIIDYLVNCLDSLCE